jgi:hypothetical protein
MAFTVELHETGLFLGMESGWSYHVLLTRRMNGKYTLKVHQGSIAEPWVRFCYRSRPFRTAGAFLDALKEAESESYSSFELGLESILKQAETLGAALASQARILLARYPWKDWDPVAESYQVTMHNLKRARVKVIGPRAIAMQRHMQ